MINFVPLLQVCSILIIFVLRQKGMLQEHTDFYLISS